MASSSVVVRSFVRSFVVRSFVRSFVRSSVVVVVTVHSLSLVRWFVGSLVGSLVLCRCRRRTFAPFVRSFVRWCVRAFVVIRPFVRWRLVRRSFVTEDVFSHGAHLRLSTVRLR